jgi:hypothetical protein
MSLYPDTIARCQHIKVNGTQCGSPALRKHRFCYFHKEWREKRLQINRNTQRGQQQITLPVFEDANSIQVALMQVTRLLLTQQIDHKTAGLLLYALQTASSNLARCTFEPELPTTVVIDRASVAKRPIGATAWSAAKDREYDDQDMNQKDGEEDSLARTLLERMGLSTDGLNMRSDDEEEEDEEADLSEERELAAT